MAKLQSSPIFQQQGFVAKNHFLRFFSGEFRPAGGCPSRFQPFLVIFVYLTYNKRRRIIVNHHLPVIVLMILVNQQKRIKTRTNLSFIICKKHSWMSVSRILESIRTEKIV